MKTVKTNWLPDMDLNHDKQIQSLLCYRYTIGQTGVSKVESWGRESRNTAMNRSNWAHRESARRSANSEIRNSEFEMRNNFESRNSNRFKDAAPPNEFFKVLIFGFRVCFEFRVSKFEFQGRAIGGTSKIRPIETRITDFD